jgi:predicted transcriptional regulator
VLVAARDHLRQTGTAPGIKQLALRTNRHPSEVSRAVKGLVSDGLATHERYGREVAVDANVETAVSGPRCPECGQLLPAQPIADAAAT